MEPATRLVPDGMIAIPAGTFRMGREDGYPEEAPAHDVTIRPIALDRLPVTNAQYRAFCDGSGRAHPVDPRWEHRPDYFDGYPDHPVVNVTYDDATAFAIWVGKRLPTEAEWEYAALGGLAARFPWGDDSPTGDRAQYATRESEYPWRDVRSGTEHRYTSPAGSFPPNGYGLRDMAGNVWEWCANWFYRYPWEEVDVTRAGEGWGLQRVVRGGAFYSPADDLRVTRRLRVFGGVGGNGTGFRCALDLVDGSPRTAPAIEALPIVRDDAVLSQIDRAALRMERGVELCLGVSPNLTDDEARRIRAMGFTSVEQYVTWETVENEAEGRFDFSAWDEQVRILKRHGLRWVPFLIAGPAYSLPDWYRRSEEFRGLVCLEHRIESRIQSIWDKRFYRHIERFLAAFAERYRDQDVIESLLLGITGDFGEAIFPVTGTTWTTIIPGYYHTHGGYWCGDRYAEADFRERASGRYSGDLDALNRAWGTAFRQPGDVTFPNVRIDEREGFRVDEPTQPGEVELRSPEDRRRWLDFVAWYRESMNDLADAWIAITRRLFPDHPIYLCTGGDAPPHHGAHFGDQCRIAARHNAGVRITNEASDYGKNFVVTHWVASAGRFYGAYFGFEPAGGVDERGVTGRIFNAAVSGAKNLHFYQPNIFDRTVTVEAWLENFRHIEVGEPDEPVALLYPDTSIVLGDMRIDALTRRLARLRDALNFDFVDDGTIAAGMLDRYRVLLIAGGRYVERDTVRAVAAWVAAGGLLIGFGTEDLRTVDGEDLTDSLFPNGTDEATLGRGTTLWLGPLGPDPAEIDRIVPRIGEWLAVRGQPLIDGKIDNVYAAQLRDRIVLLHHGHEPIAREITLADGSGRGVALPPNAIIDVIL